MKFVWSVFLVALVFFLAGTSEVRAWTSDDPLDVMGEDFEELAAEHGLELGSESLLTESDRIMGIPPAEYKALSDKFIRILLDLAEDLEAANDGESFDPATSEKAAELKVLAEQMRTLSNYVMQQMAVRRELLVGVFFPVLSWGMEVAGRRIPRIGKVGAQGSVGLMFLWAQGEDRKTRWKMVPYFLVGPNFEFGRRKPQVGMADSYEKFRDQNHIFTAGGALFRTPGIGMEINSLSDITGLTPYVGTAFDLRVTENLVTSIGVYTKFGKKVSEWTSPDDQDFSAKASRFARATGENLLASVRPSASMVYGFFAKGHQAKSLEWQHLEMLWLNTLGTHPDWADDGLFHDTEGYRPSDLLNRSGRLGELSEEEAARIRSEVEAARQREQIRR